MDYQTWMNVKTECHNDAQVSFQRMSPAAQKAMQDAHVDGAGIEVLVLAGTWYCTSEEKLHAGIIYRVSPTWPGPAKPEPKPEYVDQPVVAADGYRFAEPGEDDAGWLISLAPGQVGFCGFVYEADGKDIYLYGLVFAQQPDGSHRLRVPKAVRFLKGATV